MKRLQRSPWRTLYISCVVSAIVGVAIMGFGAPPVILVWVTFGGATIMSAVNNRARRRGLNSK